MRCPCDNHLPARQSKRLLCTSDACLRPRLLVGLNNEVRVQHLQNLLERLDRQIGAAREHSAELTGIDFGRPAKLLAGAELRIDQIGKDTGAIVGPSLYSDALSKPDEPASSYINMSRAGSSEETDR